MNAYTGIKPEEIPARMTGRVSAHPLEEGRFDAYLPSPCVQNHAANLAFLPDSTLACVWFGGTMEGMGDISIYMSRLAPGSDTWSPPEQMTDDAAKSEQNPVLFTAPDGRVWLMFTSQSAGNQDGAIVKKRISADGGRTFGPVSALCDSPGTFVRQPPVIRADGTWLVPVFRCVSQPGQRWTGNIDTAAALVSSDGGETFAMRDVPGSIGAVHMNMLALDNGRMVAFYRNRFAEKVLRSWSDDGGLTWSAPEPTDLPNNNSSIQAVRLQGGAIAMVYNHCSAAMSTDRRLSLYDEIEADGEGEAPRPEAIGEISGPTAVWGVPRAPLSLALSSDDGRSFASRRDLDTGSGQCLSNNSKEALNREYSYPSIVQGPDGALHIAYTYYRRAIKYVRLDSIFAG